jgi:hypothetical protein
MRVFKGLLTMGLVLASASGVAAQSSNAANAANLLNASSNRQSQSSTGVGVGIGVGGSSSSIGVNTNTNTLSTGNNVNLNENTNNQFQGVGNYNGSLDIQTGANNGELEVYSGASPYQGIVIEGSAPLPQLPGLLPTPGNFSQPYKPDVFVNGPPFLPAEMTMDDAKACGSSKVKWYGGSRGESKSIRLLYTAKKDAPTVPLTMSNYVGTAMASSSDGPFLAALCEAAAKAMDKGATVGVVDYILRPKNTMSGFGFGASGGGTGLPMAGANPYALAGTLGFGTGWSNQKVEGEVMVQLTGLREPAKPAAAPTAPAKTAVATPPTVMAPPAQAGESALPAAAAPTAKPTPPARPVAPARPAAQLNPPPKSAASTTPVAAPTAKTAPSAPPASQKESKPAPLCGGAYDLRGGTSFSSCQ